MTFLIRFEWLLSSVPPSEAELWTIQIGASEFPDALSLSAHKKSCSRVGVGVFFCDTRDLMEQLGEEKPW